MTTVITLGALAKAWLATLLYMAGQGTLLAIVAFFLARAGKLRPAWAAAIWLVVMVKLALPWGPAMPYSLSDVLAMFSSHETHALPLITTPGAHIVMHAPQAWPAVGWIALASIWLLGAAFVLARSLLAHRATVAAARTAPTAPVELGRIRVVVGAPDVGPHVVGLLRPIIVVPPALLADETLLRAALLHELAHVRRFDVAARFIQIIAASLLWWWPVVRIVNKRLELAREAACDAWALEASDVPRAAYARLLVRMASLHIAAAPALAAHYSLDKRVAAVLGPPARARLGWIQRVALLAWVLLALGGARRTSAHTHGEACHYTPALGMALYQSYPQADLDGDGLLSRREACDLQAELRRDRRELSSRLTPEADEELQSLLTEPLCCAATGDSTCQSILGTEP
jgi:beta-lactamase regulating signal transducer with metallopeptidase domain